MTMTLGQALKPIQAQINRQFTIDDLVARLHERGMDWSDITGTDSVDPTSCEPPTNEEIQQVREFLDGPQPKAKTRFIIEDWAGNHLHPHKSFDSFDEGWEYVREHSPEECWLDIYVVEGTPE